MMATLGPPDKFYLDAAQGWLALGDHLEARAELERISPQFGTHPDVLKVLWEILAAEKQWGPALEIARRLIQMEPDEPVGWVHQSYCLHELKRTAEAREDLLRVVNKFPSSATMRYNLACYESQLGNLEQAKLWLERAFQLGDRAKMKGAALDDPDLEP